MKVPKEIVPIISFTVFTAILVVGVNLSSRASRAIAIPTDKNQVKRKVVIFVAGVLLYFVILFVVFVLGAVTIILIWGPEFDMNPIEDWIRVVWGLGFPLVYLLFVSKERLWVLMNSLLFFAIGFCLLIVPITEVRFVDWDISPFTRLLLGATLPICWMAVILFSPLQQLTRRLGYVVLGVLTLVGLSEISKLNLHEYLQPPRVSDLRKRMMRGNAIDGNQSMTITQYEETANIRA